MQVVIVDDDVLFLEIVEKTIKMFFVQKREQVKVRCCDGTTLLKELRVQNRYDIYLLDIEMPEMDGVNLAKKIYDYDARARIVFLTSYEKYACQSYQVGVYYYIMKDKYHDELTYLLEKVCKEEEESKEECYTILTETRYCKLKMNDIMYLTKDQKYAIFHCVDGREYRERKGVENIYRTLPQQRFIVINRGIIVNVKYIIKYGKMELTMQDGKVFPVSRRESVIVRSKLADYLGSML